jgi:uncharacterized protein (DUF342 family)
MENTQDLLNQHENVNEAESDSPFASANPSPQIEIQDENRATMSPSAAQNRSDKIFEITVSDDAMEARLWFGKTAKDTDAAIHAINQTLNDLGITFGIIDDKTIIRNISSESLSNQSFKIAQGKLPAPGKGATAVYHFDTDPLKVGTVSGSGAIDYRSRGAIPQVKKGDLLAENSHGIKGTPGTDVFGRTVTPPEPRNTRVIPGKGVLKSDDGLSFYAAIDGRPEVTPEGKLSVFPDLHIQGDVCLATGHIEFDGNVEVCGTVCEGFRVKAKSLRAEEIIRARIEVDGDVVVSGGIIGAQIETAGTLTAGYIQTSTVVAEGDINVDHDVYESILESSRRCFVKHGKIVRSALTAKRGIEALDVGSSTAKPSSLIFAVDGKEKKELSELRPQITEADSEIVHLNKTLTELKEKYRTVDQEACRTVQDEDRAVNQKRALEEKIKLLHHQGRSEQQANVVTVINQLNAHISKLHRHAERLCQEQHNVRTMIDNLEDKIAQSKSDLEHMNMRYDAILHAEDTEHSDAAIIVSGTIYANTEIAGARTSSVLSETHQNVTIREVHSLQDEQEGPEWRLEIFSRK